jgi:hypothetical protein
MAVFHVSQLFEVPIIRGSKGYRQVDAKLSRELLKEWSIAKGCYVFSLRAGRGIKPIYVGKTDSNLCNEALNNRNLKNLNSFLNERKGSLVLQFLYEAPRKGKYSKKRIDDLEKMLIGFASRRNPNLLNVKRRENSVVRIKGVLNSEAGKPSRAESMLRSTLGL